MTLSVPDDAILENFAALIEESSIVIANVIVQYRMLVVACKASDDTIARTDLVTTLLSERHRVFSAPLLLTRDFPEYCEGAAAWTSIVTLAEPVEGTLAIVALLDQMASTVNAADRLLICLPAVTAT